MFDLTTQLLGALALIGVLAFGYWRLIRPYPFGFESKALLALVLLTMVGGLLGSTGWWTDNPSAFSWDLPPLASRLLGAAGWAFGAASMMALHRPTSLRVQLVLVMIVVYLVPLALAIIAFHLDRFDLTAPITPAFFFIVALMVVPALYFLARRPPLPAASPGELAAPAPPTRAWLTACAVVTGVWGALLLLTDSGPVTVIWVWPGDLLTSRLIAVMLLTIAAACLYSRRTADAARMTLVTMVIYGVGAVLAGLLNAAAGKPVPVAYVAVLGGIGIVSLILFFRRVHPAGAEV